MTRISAGECGHMDMEWYGVDKKGNLAVFCSGGEGNLPSTETGRKIFLSWSHYIKLMRIENIEERHFNELDVEDIHKRRVMYFFGKKFKSIDNIDDEYSSENERSFNQKEYM